MHKKFHLIILGVFFSACSTNPDSENVLSKSDALPLSKENNSNNIPDFLKLLDIKSTGYLGYLQGVEKNDSSGPYVFHEYYSDTLSFQLIYIHKSQKKNDISFNSIRTDRKNNYEDFILFAFVYPIKDPDRIENDDERMKFPLNVKCYIRMEKNWQFYSKETSQNLTELSQFQIQCISSVHSNT